MEDSVRLCSKSSSASRGREGQDHYKGDQAQLGESQHRLWWSTVHALLALLHCARSPEQADTVRHQTIVRPDNLLPFSLYHRQEKLWVLGCQVASGEMLASPEILRYPFPPSCRVFSCVNRGTSDLFYLILRVWDGLAAKEISYLRMSAELSIFTLVLWVLSFL